MTLVPVLGWEENIYGKEFPLGDVEWPSKEIISTCVHTHAHMCL